MNGKLDAVARFWPAFVLSELHQKDIAPAEVETCPPLPHILVRF